MQIFNSVDDPLDKEIVLDPKSFKKNPFSKFITADQKLDMILRAAYVDSKLTKDEFRNRVDLVLG